MEIYNIITLEECLLMADLCGECCIIEHGHITGFTYGEPLNEKAPRAANSEGQGLQGGFK